MVARLSASSGAGPYMADMPMQPSARGKTSGPVAPKRRDFIGSSWTESTVFQKLDNCADPESTIQKGPTMDRIRAMEVFTKVVETGSFTAAARALRLPRASATTLVQAL